MRSERGFSNTATVLLALLLAVLVAPLLMTWVVVDVHTTGHDEVNLTVPVPLALARIALAFVPTKEAIHDLPAEVAQHKEQVLAALRAIESCPDAMLVEVQAPDAKVKVAKRGDRLVVDVDAPDAVVHGALPVKAALRVLERWDWKTVEPHMAIDFLAHAGHGELVRVEAPDAKVAVRIW
jgi:hypothetical protein